VAEDEPDHDAESANFLAAYEAGDKLMLWRAIVYCAANRIPPFEWLRQGILAIDNAAEAGEIKSWDTVFGRRPWGKGQRRRAQSWGQRFRVWEAVRKAQHAGGVLHPLNNRLFGRVARIKFGRSKVVFGRSKVVELYGSTSKTIARVLRDFGGRLRD
jgi:hypothetical protein